MLNNYQFIGPRTRKGHGDDLVLLPPFTNEETGLGSLGDLPKVTQVVCGRSVIQTQVLCHSIILFSTSYHSPVFLLGGHAGSYKGRQK